MRSLRFFILAFLIPMSAFSADIEKLRETIVALTNKNTGRAMATQGHEDARIWIENKFREYGLVKLGNDEHTSYQQTFTKWDKDGVNLIGGLGDFSGDKQCVILGAHYDGVENGPAADDNASGIAGMLEIARQLSYAKSAITQCVIFAAWDFEEAPHYNIVKGVLNYRTLGTNGSAYFSNNPTIPLEQIQLSITFDLIGGDFFKGAENLFMILGIESSPKLRPLVNRNKSSLPAKMEGLNFDIRALEPFHNILGDKDGHAHQRSDYDGFRDNNVPFLFITTGMPWYYHTAFDREENINYRKLKAITDYTKSVIANIIFVPDMTMITRSDDPTQDQHETAESMRVVLSSLLYNAGSNHLDATLEFDGKSINGPEIRGKLQGQLDDLRMSISNGDFYSLNTPMPKYALILKNIVTATHIRLMHEKIELTQKSADHLLNFLGLKKPKQGM